MLLPSQHHSWSIGRARVSRIDDLCFAFAGASLFAGWDPRVSPGEIRGLGDGLLADADGQQTCLAVHSWLVQIDGCNILIDTGVGNDKDRSFLPAFHRLNTPYLANLAEAGARPDDIDFVLLTHLHSDHVGWNTRWDGAAWQPTFPKARYLYAAAEEAFCMTPAAEARRPVFEDSLQPLIDAGQIERIGPEGGRLDEHFTFHPTPGHSPGHLSISLEADGEVALFGGDVLHHPLQLLHPDWNSCFCGEAVGARHSRAWALDYVKRHHAVYFSSHFAGSGVVLPDDDGMV